MEEVIMISAVVFGLVASALLLLSSFLKQEVSLKKKMIPNFPPEIPGLPLIGNLGNLDNVPQHQKFKQYADEYGPVYIFKAGCLTQVIVNSSAAATEVLDMTNASLFRKFVPNCVKVLSRGSNLVAFRGHDEKYLKLKKLMVGHFLGESKETFNRSLLGIATDCMIRDIFCNLKKKSVNVREVVSDALFSISVTQIFGRCPKKLFVDELGILDRVELYNLLVQDPIDCAATADWRDFFPMFSWVPSDMDDYAKNVSRKAGLVIRALLSEHIKLRDAGVTQPCYANDLLNEAKDLSGVELEQLLWEPLLESLDNSVLAVEMAIHELSRNPDIQDRVSEEIKNVVDLSALTDEHLPKLPLLTAVVSETLRKYPPIVSLSPRVATKDVQIGGYSILQGWQVIVNTYGVHMDDHTFPTPELWNPDRFLDCDAKVCKLLSFGAGQRECPGKQQATAIVTLTIGTLVHHFQWNPKLEVEEAFVGQNIHGISSPIVVATPRV